MPTRRSPVVAHLFASHDTLTSLSLGGFLRILPRCQQATSWSQALRSDLHNSSGVRNHSLFSLVLNPLVSNQANHMDRLGLTPNGD